MTKNLKELLEKDAADLNEAEAAELKAASDQLNDEQKEKFAAVLKLEVTGTDDIDNEESEDEESEDDEENEEGGETLEVKAVYDAKAKVAVASTDVVDRHGERINQEGWDLKNFKKNPVMLWGHDHTEIAVGNARNIHIERASGKPRLVFTPDFHEKTEKARALKSLYEDGWLNSFSVGFLPKDFDGKDQMYLKQELLEISAVNVPANAEATMLAYKSLVDKGFKKTIAKDAVGVDEEPVPEETPEEKKSLVEIMKGALADEIVQNEDQELKWENMEDVQDVFWAFCDVYYNEDTPVDDFLKLLGELVAELQKLVDNGGELADDPDEEDPNKSVGTNDEDEEEKPAPPEVLDNNPDNTDDENNTVKTQDNKDTSVAPKLTQEARAKQSLSKVIAKASDIILEDKSNKKDTVELTKVIKRAAEILNKAHKNN